MTTNIITITDKVQEWESLCTWQHITSLKTPVKFKIETELCEEVDFTWEILVHVGTPKQKTIMNKLRLEYVNILDTKIKTSCGTNAACAPAKVGTTMNISAESDIDINLNLTGQFMKSNKNIAYVYDTIYAYHHMHFQQNITDLFDINIYGTNFPNNCSAGSCFQDNIIVADDSQRYWAFTRLLEGCSAYLLKNIKSLEQSSKLNNIISSSKIFINKIPNNKDGYIINLQNFFKSSEDNKAAIKAFSLAKYYENETYRSAGAFLHIVSDKRDMSPILYMDSLIDNLGFAIENLVKKVKCVEIPLDWKLLRVAKYLQRMVDAIALSQKIDFKQTLKAQTQTSNCSSTVQKSESCLLQIYKLCDELNKLRKQGKYDDVHNKFATILKQIKVTDNNVSQLTEDSIATQLLEFALNYYKKVHENASPTSRVKA